MFRQFRQQLAAACVDEPELRDPTFITVYRVIWCSIRSFFVERPGQIIGSAFLLIMLWGTHGKLELLGVVWSDWRGPGSDPTIRPELIPGVPWDHELISFWVGALLLVVVPILLIRYYFKQPLANYGLGLPARGRWQLAGLTFILLIVVSVPAFVIGAQSEGMRDLYPFYDQFADVGQFLLYELTYLPFFIAIEFIFRGYLLFGLARVRDDVVYGITGAAAPPRASSEQDIGAPGVFYFSKYSLLIQMLAYTAWHLGKPLPELWGTVIWGLAAGATAYVIRSLWPIILAHWLLNVLLDAIIVWPLY